MAGSPDEDPLLELRESLVDEDEPLFPAGGGSSAPAAPAPPRAAPPSQPPPMAPPPLPPRGKTVSGNQPAHLPTRPPSSPGASGPGARKQHPTGIFPPGTLSPMPPGAA